MPFIGGRYYANALAGHAVEAAREAEAALLALKNGTGQKTVANPSPFGEVAVNSDSENGSNENDASELDDSADELMAPVHRVEIEAAELVPSHTGRAQRGFVARVHRNPGLGGDVVSGSAGSRVPLPGQLPSRGYSPKPETHVFAGHGDLLDFLKSELSK